MSMQEAESKLDRACENLQKSIDKLEEAIDAKTIPPADGGGPAFPSHGTMGEVVCEGMSLRDYFAAKAIQALYTVTVKGMPKCIVDRECVEAAAHDAYMIADAMLAARK
jgi:hypothetical protein